MIPRRRTQTSLAGALLVGALGVIGAGLALLDESGAWSVPAAIPQAMAAIGVAVALFVLGVLAHVWRRDDLTRAERIVLSVALVAFPPGALVYPALGRERTRGFARRVLRMFEPMRVSGGASG